MASIEFIQKRIEGREKEIDKLQKKLDRIKKAQATNWEVNPYYYSESDLRWTEKDLQNALDSLEQYKADLEVAQQKAASRDVPAITEFLDRWKEHLTNWYSEGIDTYYDESERISKLFQGCSWYSEEYKKAQEESHKLYERVHGKFEKQERPGWNGRMREVDVKVADGDLEPYAFYLTYPNRQEAKERLEKDLKAEYDRKYDFIIERTNAIVGTITDASQLRVGAKGDLNGYIIGTNGTAKVQTIGAGGYNIQCFHFRTLINPMR